MENDFNVDEVLAKVEELALEKESLSKSFEDLKKTHEQEIEELKKSAESSKEDLDKIKAKHAEDLESKSTELEELKKELEKKVDEFDTLQQLKNAPSSAKTIKQDKKMDKKTLFKKASRKLAETMKKAQSLGGEKLLSWDSKLMASDSDPDGGYVTSVELTNNFVELARDISPFMQYADVVTTEKEAYSFPVNKHGGSTGGWVAQRDTRSETSTPQMGRTTIYVHEQYSMPALTNQFLEDADVDAVSWINKEVADDLMESSEDAWVNGDAEGMPRGFLTYPDGTAWGQIEQLETSTASTIVASDIWNLAGLLKKKYERGAVFVGNKKTLFFLKGLEDSNGNNLWSAPLETGAPSSIAGYPFVELENMPDIADGALALAFGNFKEGYRIVQRRGMEVIVDNVTVKGQTLFYTTVRSGADVKNFQAIKLLKIKSA